MPTYWLQGWVCAGSSEEWEGLWGEAGKGSTVTQGRSQGPSLADPSLGAACLALPSGVP